MAGAVRSAKTSLNEGFFDGKFEPPSIAELDDWLAHFVSPGDLAGSRSLEQVGAFALGADCGADSSRTTGGPACALARLAGGTTLIVTHP